MKHPKFQVSFKGKAITITDVKTKESASLVYTAAGIFAYENFAKGKKYILKFMEEAKRFLDSLANPRFRERLAVLVRTIKSAIGSMTSFRKLYNEVKIQNIATVAL